MGSEQQVPPAVTERVARITGATPLHRGIDTTAASIGLRSAAIVEAPVAVYTVDLLGRVTSWNPAAERLFGWTEAEILGQVIPFIPDDELDQTLAGVEVLMQGTPLSNITYEPVRKDGTRRHVLTTATMLTDDAGSPASVLCFAVDVTEREQARLVLADASYRWRRLLENISDTITLLDADLRVIESTGQFSDVLGYDADWWGAGMSALDLIHPEDRPTADALAVEVLAHPGAEFTQVFRTRHADGHYEHIEYSVVNLLDDPGVAGIVISSNNVSEVRKAEMLLQNEARILELVARDAPLDETLPAIVAMVEHHAEAATTLYLLDESGDHLTAGAPGQVPPPVVRLFERVRLDPDRGVGAAVFGRETIVVDDVATSPYTSDAAAVFAAHGVASGWARPIIESRTDEVLGCIITLHATTRAPTAHEREVGAVASHLASIAIERDRFQRRLFHQARHNQLTGLPNRHAIGERLDELLTQVRSHEGDDRRPGGRAAVMFIDLDRFKVVNDSFGHASGDHLLVRFAGRLQNLVRQGDFVGHFAADEFVVLLDDVHGLDDVQFVADRIDAALDEPFALDEGHIYLTVSIGVALADRTSTSESLLHQADAALFEAKQLGGDRLAVYDTAMQTRAVEHLRVDRDLRLAIEQGDLELQYQPEIDVGGGMIVGAEALLRWQHTDRGLVFPKDFIGVAEDTGLIVRIGRWVIEEAVRQVATWRRLAGHEDVWVSVNLSARQLTWRDLVPVVAAALRDAEVDPDALMLEITESVLIDDAEAALHVLGELKALGVRLAIDDFGTGFSSLSYLHRFPVDVVKIDRAFVSPLGAPDGSPVAAAVVQMARALGIETCAEGVESPEQLAALRTLGCDVAQGFLFATAVPAADFVELLASAPRW